MNRDRRTIVDDDDDDGNNENHDQLSNKVNILRSIYYDVSNPASFGSVDKLYREARTRDDNISRRDVENYLSSQLTYTLHRKIVRKFKRNPTIANHHGYQAQADLIDIQKYATQNSGFRYILTVIDVFSKLAYAIPLKNKKGPTVAHAFSELLQRYRPARLQTDEGTEFTNKHVQSVLRDHFVHYFIAKNEVIKCAVIERFQRTLMSRVHKYLTSKGTRKFVHLLDNFVRSYNSSMHRSLLMAPIDATKPANKSLIFQRLYKFKDRRELLKYQLRQARRRSREVGDIVRIPVQKNIFAKGYRQNFTDQLYKVIGSNPSGPRPVYRLKSADNDEREKVHGVFYPEELQKVTSQDLYRVSILREKGKGPDKQVLIQFENTDAPSRWIRASDLESID